MRHYSNDVNGKMERVCTNTEVRERIRYEKEDDANMEKEDEILLADQ